MAENLSKEVKYLGKDFASLRNNLIDFAKYIFQIVITILTNLHLV